MNLYVHCHQSCQFTLTSWLLTSLPHFGYKLGHKGRCFFIIFSLFCIAIETYTNNKLTHDVRCVNDTSIDACATV